MLPVSLMYFHLLTCLSSSPFFPLYSIFVDRGDVSFAGHPKKCAKGVEGCGIMAVLDYEQFKGSVLRSFSLLDPS